MRGSTRPRGSYLTKPRSGRGARFGFFGRSCNDAESVRERIVVASPALASRTESLQAWTRAPLRVAQPATSSLAEPADFGAAVLLAAAFAAKHLSVRADALSTHSTAVAMRGGRVTVYMSADTDEMA